MGFDSRLVIDTGVLVSAAIRPTSVPALALEKALLHFDVCVSSETLAELETVLLRPKFDVASDPHLTSLNPWRGIPIVPPAAFLVGNW